MIEEHAGEQAAVRVLDGVLDLRCLLGGRAESTEKPGGSFFERLPPYLPLLLTYFATDLKFF